MAFRDLAGLRLHAPRLAEHAADLALWPGSVTVTDDLAVMRAKIGYTAFQAHLGELVRLLAHAGVAGPAAWRVVRTVLDEESVDSRRPRLPDRADDAAQGPGPDAAGRRGRRVRPGQQPAP